MRTKQKLFLVAMAAALLAVAPSLPSQAAGPLRSGTIVSGTGESPGNFWVRGMEGCVGAPACSAWLQSACNPALAGRDPALHASIVDVSDLADTDRVLRLRAGVGINWGGVIVQFWTGTALGTWDYCGEILASRFTFWDCDGPTHPDPGPEDLLDSDEPGGGVGCTFRIPNDARWMTITSRTDNTNIAWTLT